VSELGTFSNAAKGLARNPLGIIALFIVLIYGFAALTLGISSSFGPAERLPLVWFLVLFPILVLFLFVWLVSQHHEKLYAPGDYKSDEGFLEGTKTRAQHAQLQGQLDQMKVNIRETLIASSGENAALPQDVDNLMEKLSTDIDRATTVTVDARKFLKDEDAIFHIPIAVMKSLNDLTDAVYFKLNSAVRPFEYGYSWLLRNKDSGEVVRNARMITGAPAGLRLPDFRTLGEVDIDAGDILVVERP
jgi:hypothetical protein